MTGIMRALEVRGLAVRFAQGRGDGQSGHLALAAMELVVRRHPDA